MRIAAIVTIWTIILWVIHIQWIGWCQTDFNCVQRCCNQGSQYELCVKQCTFCGGETP